jgi:hypothetical protein
MQEMWLKNFMSQIRNYDIWGEIQVLWAIIMQYQD